MAKEFKTKVWLPEDTDSCEDYNGRCDFLLGNVHCILLDVVLSIRDDEALKHKDCPAYGK